MYLLFKQKNGGFSIASHLNFRKGVELITPFFGGDGKGFPATWRIIPGLVSG